MASRTVTAAVTLPRLQVSGALRLCPAIVSAPLVLPKLQVAATVTIRSPSGMSATIALPKLQVSGALRLCPAIVSAPLVLPKLQVAATVTISSPKGVSATIALPQLQASGALRLCPAIVSAPLVLPKLQVAGEVTISSPSGMSATIALPQLQVSGAIRLSPAIVSAPLVLPKLQVAGAVRVRHFARCGVVYSLAQEVDGASLTLRYWTVARDAACAQRVGWSLSVPMGWQGQIDYEGPRLLVALGVVYSIRLAVQQRFSWRLPLIAAWVLRYGSRMGVDWLAQWGAAPSARAQLGLAWGASPSARAQLGIAWGVAPSARAQLGIDWGSTGGLRVPLAVHYSLVTAGPRCSHVFSTPLNDRFRVIRQWSASWVFPDASTSTGGGVFNVPVVKLVASGRDVQFLAGLSLAQDVRDGLWRLQATVAQPVARGEVVVVSVGPNVWHLVATQGSIERADVLSGEYRLVAASAPALWDGTPIGQLLGREAWHTGLASDIARALASPCELSWSLSDPLLPAPIVHEALWGLSRWAALQRLARASGGWAVVSPDGTSVVCRSSGAARGHYAPLEASWSTPEPVAVMVSNRAIADSISDDADLPSVTSDVKNLWVRPVPWRAVVLRATDPAVLSTPVQTDAVQTETIDLTAGVGQLGRPVDALLSAEVWPSSAGPLRWRVDDVGVWLDKPVHATARIKYSSRALSVAASSPALVPTLITLEDVSL